MNKAAMHSWLPCSRWHDMSFFIDTPLVIEWLPPNAYRSEAELDLIIDCLLPVDDIVD